ncbi:phosphatase PAP2 family protein [Herminiimonas aquatilis]|uniref:Phosphatase PAP2 family protein n=1 Tax=Herminiimonas aquatilis TaxID=345342 RepID=A0ABW2J8K7_9BURK
MKNFANAELTSYSLQLRNISDIPESERGLCSFNTRYLFGIFVSLAGFFLLSALTQLSRPWSFESSLLLSLHSYASPFFDQLALIASASVTVAGVIVLIFLVYRRAWYASTFLLAATLGTEAIAQVTKHIFHHSRPQLWDVISHQSSYGFPSGHAAVSMSIVLALFSISIPQSWDPAHKLACVAFVAAVGFSRMYLGVHFPIDILAGWSLAIAWVCMLRLMFKSADRRIGIGRAL